jgi:hypothetical protein
MATYSELSQDPLMNANLMEVLTDTPDAAAATAKKLSTLPEVGQARTIDNFVPNGQIGKIAAIQSAADKLKAVLDPSPRPPPPTDADNVAALKSGAEDLLLLADAVPGPGGDAAKRLAADLNKVATGPLIRARASLQAVLTQPLVMDLEALRHALRAEAVTRATLPEAIRRSWVSPDGRARVELVPKAGHEFTTRQFALAVMKAEPTATGPAIGELEWGTTIIHAFVVAGVCALIAIAVLLWIALRKLSDVALTLVPLLAAALVTLELCALLNFPLNYANIIALPVLLGVGVAFKIYYVMAWRSGQSDFLQSPLTRAVLFSALMTATAFGSLSFSSHPGTASMGKLLALSLACTLASAALFQPALMGKPRGPDENA